MRGVRVSVGAIAAALMLAMPALAHASPPLAHASPPLCGLPLLPACPAPPTTTTTTPTTTPTPTPTPTPAAPAPLVDAGAQYAGRDSFHWYDVITVAKDGRRLSAFDLGFQHGSCSNHQVYYSEFGSSVKHGAAISSAGRVSDSSFSSHATFLTTRGKLIRGREEIKFTIQFSAGRLRGTLRDTFRSAKLRCSSGTVSFAAYPFGTAQAPLDDATTGTGSYRGETNENADPVSLQVFLPLLWVHTFRISWRAYCRNGASFRSTSTLYLLFISRSRFSMQTAGVVPADRQGLSERYRVRLTGQFFVSSPNYDVEGTWEWSDSVYRAGRRLGTCTTGPVTFSATGPRAPLPAG
jgi:hypothetical protein